MKTNLSRAILILLLCTAACTPVNEKTATQKASSTNDNLVHQASQRSISPPLAGVNVPTQHFTIQAEQTKNIDLPNGTQIYIPAGTLVDKEGKALTGEVDLTYREFHDAIDVLLSGIPMTYETADGKEEIFQTAGMMEINASQNGQEVFIAEGKSIKIEMASFVEPPADTRTMEDDYQLYYLNESTGMWEDRGENNPSPNPRLADMPTQPAPKPLPARPMKPKKPSKDEVVFDFAVDYRKYPELAPYDGISWQYANIDSDEPGMINPNEAKWVFGEVWKDARVKEMDGKKGLYVLQIKNKRKKAQMIVTPVMEGDKYEDAMAKYQEINRRIAAVKKQTEIELKRREQQAKMVRAFSVDQFGTYNCDRFYRIPDARMIVADFNFPAMEQSETAQMAHIDKVYQLIPGSRAMVTYNRSSQDGAWGAVNYSPSEKTYLLAMLPNNEVAMFGPEDFAAIDFKRSHTFEMKSTGKKIESPDQLRALLSM